MILKGLLYVLICLLSGAFSILALVLGIVKYSADKQGAGRWFIGFGVGLLVLFASIFMIVRGVMHKTKSFANSISYNSSSQMRYLDSIQALEYADDEDVLSSDQVNLLKSYEPLSFKNAVPNSFYSYLGFSDYYRLPLRFPFSLHCTDSLGNAELFDEEDVIEFDKSENNEVFAGLDGINEFYFNANYLIGTKYHNNGKSSKTIYFSFDFNTKQVKEYNSEKEFKQFLRKVNIDPAINLTTCEKYFGLFSL